MIRVPGVRRVLRCPRFCCCRAFGAAPASAQSAPGLRVTIAARSCPSYEVITANLARNDIQESCTTSVPTRSRLSGQPIDPDLEAQGQPTCNRCPDWQFTLWTAGTSRAPCLGTWGFLLSIVTGPRPPTRSRPRPPCRCSTTEGSNDGGQAWLGATTSTLTDEQAVAASGGDALWPQGGTTRSRLDPTTGSGTASARCAAPSTTSTATTSSTIAFPTSRLRTSSVTPTTSRRRRPAARSW